jgi:hypothetical protein
LDFFSFGTGAAKININFLVVSSTTYNIYLALGSTNVITYTTPTDLGLNTWVHLAVTITSGSVVKLYINGIQPTPVTYAVGTYPSGQQSTTNSIGQHNGYTDDFRLYDRVLSDAEILSIYNNINLMTIGIENSAGVKAISLFASGGTGFVGVNTKTPQYSLDVSGTLNTNSDAVIYGLRVGRGPGNNLGNIAFGANTLDYNSITNGYQNSAIGYQTLSLNTEGHANSAVGYRALTTNTTGGNNTAVGALALNSNITTNNNTAIGYAAGYWENTNVGNCNTFLGAFTGLNGNYSYSTAIGFNARITASNQIVLGRNEDSVYVGTNLLLQGDGTASYIRSTIGSLYLGYGSTNNVLINSTGLTVTGAINATSDYRVKENVVPLDASFTVDGLNPVTYNLKSSGQQDIGFIAHEVQEFYPFLVSGKKDGKDTQSLNYNGFIGILTKEIQVLKKKEAKALAKALEQEARISDQDQRIQALEKMMLDLINK